MKKLFFLTLLTIISVSLCSAQKITKNEVDEFTGSKVIETSWEKLALNKKGQLGVNFRFRKVNEYTALNLKMMHNSVFAISEGAKLMFIMDDKSIYELNSLSYEISSRGAGATGLSGSNAPGINIQYISNEDEDFTVLRDKLVTKMRIYTTDGYIDSDIEEKDAKTFQQALKLLFD